ncbi:MAG: type VI secretion system tube protein TssD [Saprospiraceae bacterium]|nr:hypothetical protein [Lewinella sp.]
MASVIKAQFVVDGQESEIIAFSYSLDQNIDNIGQPAGEVRGGQITVTLGTNGTESRFGWMVASDMKKSGEIKMTDANGQTLKTIAFEDAFCVGYTEEYEAFSGGQSGGVNIKESAKETLILSCRTIDVAGEVHENTWV